MFFVSGFGLLPKQEGAIKRYLVALTFLAGLAIPLGCDAAPTEAAPPAPALAAANEHVAKNRDKISINDLAGKYSGAVKAAAIAHGVPPRIVASILFVESHGKMNTVSKSGAIGLMQIMPDTAAKTLKINPWNAQQNIDGGAAYISGLIDRFGSVRAGLIAYNEGPTLLARGVTVPAAADYADEVEDLASTG